MRQARWMPVIWRVATGMTSRGPDRLSMSRSSWRAIRSRPTGLPPSAGRNAAGPVSAAAPIPWRNRRRGTVTKMILPSGVRQGTSMVSGPGGLLSRAGVCSGGVADRRRRGCDAARAARWPPTVRIASRRPASWGEGPVRPCRRLVTWPGLQGTWRAISRTPIPRAAMRRASSSPNSLIAACTDRVRCLALPVWRGRATGNGFQGTPALRLAPRVRSCTRRRRRRDGIGGWERGAAREDP